MKLRLFLSGFGLCLAIVALALAGSAWAGIPSLPPPPAPPVWGPNIIANTDSSGYGQHEPNLAASFTNPNIVVAAAKDYREGNIKHVWIYGSTDGGQSWPTQLHMPGLPPDVPLQSDPVVVARDDGRIFVLAIGYNQNNGLFLTWTDDGVNFVPSVPVIYGNGSLNDKPWLAIDNNPASPYYHRMYIAWAPGGVVNRYSTDGGLTWSASVPIPPSGNEYPYPVVTQNGDVFVFTMAPWGFCVNGSIYYAKSTNGGVSFGSAQAVVSTSQPCSPIHGGGGFDQWRFFSIISAVTNPLNNNELYVAWTDDNNVTYGQTDVYYVRSTDHGVTWTPRIRLSHDPAGSGRDHITPVLFYGSNGRLHALWMDRREDPANQLFHTWYSSSTDMGETWEADSRVSEVAQNMNIGLPPGSGGAAGDYWGLWAVGDIVYTAWNDTRRNEQDIWTARGVFGAATPTPTVAPTITPSPTPTHPPTSVELTAFKGSSADEQSSSWSLLWLASIIALVSITWIVRQVARGRTP